MTKNAYFLNPIVLSFWLRSFEFVESLDGNVNVGVMLLRGTQSDSPDLEGLISDSQLELSNRCRNFLENSNLTTNHCYSKRLRFAERACNPTDLRDVSYHALYGNSSGIDLDSPSFQALKDFLILE